MDIYYIDGEFVSADRAVIPVNDLAVLRGLGAFELLRTYGGHPFGMEEHRLLRIVKTFKGRQILQMFLDRHGNILVYA